MEVIDRYDKRVKLRPFDGDERLRSAPSTRRAAILHDARITDATGVTITGKARQRVVDRLMIDTGNMPPIFDPTAEGAVTRAYIPGLWNHGTVPAFIGPKGWGKTKLLFGELAPSLLIPDRRFLGAFEATQMTDAERARDVWMINSETRPTAVHEELIAGGLSFSTRAGVPCYVGPFGLDAGVLIVEHLPASGGATLFDLTDPAKAGWWEERLIRFTGTHEPPLVVVADGVSAMLGNDTNRYGAFTSAFRRLLQEAGIPNGLGVLHSPMDPRVNTPMNGLESMGEWDGMWIARADRFPIFPTTPRHFLTLPRLGDPIVSDARVSLGDDGRLTLGAASEGKAVAPVAPVDSERDRLLRKLSDAGGWAWTKTLCGTGDAYTSGSKLLKVLRAEGVVESREHQEGKIRGVQWRLPESDED
ncbi:hypothetical protein [Microbacterium oxydans]|uniref:hypothetical protein n=1 Tax=Microbacterium oxydans TaxID=82380 RepID=UPI0012E09090|nr:hypothetical protein [Microbacterium oxydans]